MTGPSTWAAPDPTLHPPGPDHRHVLCWRFPQRPLALSSASVGGGLSRPAWLVNIGVPQGYSRTDLAAHAAEVAAGIGLDGPGVALFTAHDVRLHHRAEHEGVRVTATVGATRPTWPADLTDTVKRWTPGTINIIATLPVRLEDAALVQAAVTLTEAKCQALIDAGVPGTGTASDALAVLVAPDGPAEPFAGVRSTWGHRLAIATHAAVTEALSTHPPIHWVPEAGVS